MTDSILISDLTLWTHIGITEEERSTEQRLLVSIDLKTDLSEAGAADDLSKSIDYQSVCDSIKPIAAKQRQTIECLAEDIAEHILRTYKASRITVTVKKFCIPETDHVSVTITRP